MRYVLILLTVLVPGVVMAQAPGAKPTPRPTMEEAGAAFAVQVPDEGSPFFAERQAAKYALSQPGQQRAQAETVAVYPRVKNSPGSATGMLTSFFTDMFSSIQWRSFRREKTTQKLKLDPEEFSLKNQGEVEAVYTVRNNTGKIIRIDYATSQRIDLLTTDSTGKVLEQWSNDRSFHPQEGIVILNPKERIEYREKVATRDMKADESYVIKAEVVEHPEYSASRAVTPTP
jgi:hypothetical protein